MFVFQPTLWQRIEAVIKFERQAIIFWQLIVRSFVCCLLPFNIFCQNPFKMTASVDAFTQHRPTVFQMIVFLSRTYS